MAENTKVGAITYREADEEYFAKRTLRRHAGVWSLWALGVAAVISGEFFGWNFGLAVRLRRAAGRDGRDHGHVLRPVLHHRGDVPALPHTGGAYSFARSAMGPWGGFTTGVAETIEYIVTPAVIVVGISQYMQSIIDDLFGFSSPSPSGG